MTINIQLNYNYSNYYNCNFKRGDFAVPFVFATHGEESLNLIGFRSLPLGCVEGEWPLIAGGGWTGLWFCSGPLLSLLFSGKRCSGPNARGEVYKNTVRLGACVYPQNICVPSLQDVNMVMRIQVSSHEESQAPGLLLSDLKQPAAAEKTQMPDNHHSTGSKPVQMQRLVMQISLLLSKTCDPKTSVFRMW